MEIAQHSRPLWIGILASILFVPLLMALLMMFSAERIMIPPLLVLIMGLVIATPVAVFVEFPFVLLLRKLGLLNAIYLCLAGVLVGAIVMGLYAHQSNYWPQMNDQAHARWVAQQAALKALLPGSIYGLLSAAAFSLGAGLTICPSRRRNRGAA